MEKSIKIRLICVIRVRFHRSTGSLPSGLRQWRRAKGGLGIGERGAQNFSMSTTAKNAKLAKINIYILFY
ncbi:MAG: hypothetical protein KKD46_02590 [Euryarchaeota archaeon]|nr:hypothetical protein [Euryarchaeota archaeon]MBU4339796.1 hypothetical protein [Euryarchaeota archaeon]MCG2737029.1 hypothetical protein [Candidatus Methanoperedenaceae archaeon]